MATTESAVALLRDCEAKLRLLVAERLQAGDYDAVIQFTKWASVIASLPTGDACRVALGRGA
jgi:hypothetical protein